MRKSEEKKICMWSVGWGGDGDEGNRADGKMVVEVFGGWRSMAFWAITEGGVQFVVGFGLLRESLILCRNVEVKADIRQRRSLSTLVMNGLCGMPHT